MRTINKILVGLALLHTGTVAYGQDAVLLRPKEGQPLKGAAILNKMGYAQDPKPVSVDLGVLEKADTLKLQFDNKELKVLRDQFTIRDDNDLSYSANSTSGYGGIVMSVLDDDIQGIIYTGTDVYGIITTSPGEYAVVKTDPGQYPEEDCVTEKEEPGALNGTIQEKAATIDNRTGNNDSAFLQGEEEGTECRIRVLVLYTPAAEAGSSNIENNIRNKVDITNQSFRKSGINYEIELVYIGRTDYEEQERNSTELHNFGYDNDGYMDEVFDLVKIYSADIKVLINDPVPRTCGISYTGGKSCVVNYGCDYNYTFTHEIGHSLGCRHDRFTTGNSNSYYYGYVYVPGKWRTIMAYNNQCKEDGVSCTRLLYWSTPNINHNGVPMGTELYENCVTVWNENSEAKMQIRQPQNNVSLSYSNMYGMIHADILAKQTIATTDSLFIPSCSTVSMKAGARISLGPGFSASGGADFNATLGTVTNCGN